jgi:hypothetical protein
VPARTAPGAEVDGQRRITPGHRQPLARPEAVERPVQQQVAALVEPQVSEVDKGGSGVSARHGDSIPVRRPYGR